MIERLTTSLFFDSEESYYSLVMKVLELQELKAESPLLFRSRVQTWFVTVR